MAIYNREQRALTLNAVYYGPPGSGKSANLAAIRKAWGMTACSAESAEDELCHKFLLPTMRLDVEPPLSLTIDVSTVRGTDSSGELFHSLLASADGVVFVVDARRQCLRQNIVAWADFLKHLRELGLDSGHLPVVLQFNHKDGSDCMELADLGDAINPRARACFEASTHTGQGIGKCFNEIVRAMAGLAYFNLSIAEQGYSRGAFSSAVDAVLLRLAAAPVELDPVPLEPASAELLETEAPTDHHTETSLDSATGVMERESPWVDDSDPMSEPVWDPGQQLAQVTTLVESVSRDITKPLVYLQRLMAFLEEQEQRLPEDCVDAIKAGNTVIQHLARTLHDTREQVRAAVPPSSDLASVQDSVQS